MVSLDPVSLFAGLCVGAAVGALYHLWRSARLSERIAHLTEDRTALDLAFRTVAQDALKGASEQFLLLAQERLKQTQAEGGHDLDKRQKAIADLADPIQKSLKDMETRLETLGKAGAGLESQLKVFAEDQRALRQETQNLVQALRNPAARGRWGEMQLQRALEMVGMVEGIHFVQQEQIQGDGSKLRPDFVIHLPGGMDIVIDVKTPMDPYWDAMAEGRTEQDRAAALETFRKTIRGHLRTLASKDYWRGFDSPEFVVMFLPTESLYSFAITADPELLEEAARQKVIIASPTTVMGLLRVAMYGWQQQKLADEARKISDLAVELYRRVAKFGDHMLKVGRNLDTAVGAYNQAVGSLESMVLPGVRKLKDYHISTGTQDIPAFAAIETAARPVTAAELLGTADNGQEEDADTKVLEKSGKNSEAA